MHCCEALDGVPITRATNIDMATTAAGTWLLRIKDTDVAPAEVPFQYDVRVENLQTAAGQKRQHACPINGRRFSERAGALFQIAMGKLATAQIEDNRVGKLDVRIWLQHA